MKKPKKVIVYKKPYQAYSTAYQCPHCLVNFEGFQVTENTLKFTCTSCGQPLIPEFIYTNQEVPK